MSFDLVATVQQQISPDLIGRMARSQGLDPALAAKAVGALVPGMLRSITAGVANPATAAQLASDLGALGPETMGQIAQTIGGPHHANLVGGGTQLLSQITGEQATAGLTQAVGRFAGTSADASKGLVGLSGAAVMAALAQVQRSHGLDARGLANVLGSQADSMTASMPPNFMRELPGGMIEGFGTGTGRPSVPVGPGAGVNGYSPAVATTGVAAATGVAASAARDMGGTTGGARTSPTGTFGTGSSGTSGTGGPPRGSGRWLALAALLLALGSIWWLISDYNAKKQRAMMAEKARIEVAAKVKAEAEVAAAKARVDEENRRKAEAEAAAKARAEAEARQKAEVEAAAKARAEAAERQKAEMEAKARAEEEAKTKLRMAEAEGVAKARAEAEGKAKAEAEAAAMKVRAEADAKAKTEAEAAAMKAKAEADAEGRKKAETEAIAMKARAEADAKAKTEAEAAAMKARAEADAAAAKARSEADAKAKMQAEVDQAAAARAASEAKGKAESEARKKAEAEAAAMKARAEADAKAKAEAEAASAMAAAKARADAEAKQKMEMAALATKRETEIKSCQTSVTAAATSGPLRFTVAKATLATESTATLDKLAAAIKACPSAKLRIEGHTDSDGTEERNQKLSENRAKAVLDYLTTAGVEPARMTSAGFGELKPIVPNDTDENKAKNRRIEFVVEAK